MNDARESEPMPSHFTCEIANLKTSVYAILFGAAIVGCSAHAVPPHLARASEPRSAAIAPVIELPDALLDGAIERYSKRIISLKNARILTAISANTAAEPAVFRDDEGKLEATDVPIESIVVGDSPWPRIVVDLITGPRLLLYVNPQDVEPTVVAPTLLRLELLKQNADADEPEPGAIVYPGLVLRILEQLPAQIHVEWRDETLRMEGWLSHDSLTRVYRPVTVPDIARKALEVKPGTSILTAPRGEIVAQMLGTQTLAAEPLERPKSGFVKVLIRHDRFSSLMEHCIHYEVRGYVPETALLGETGGTVTAAGMQGVSGGGETVRIAKGTRLFDQARGNIIGVATVEFHAAPGESLASGWQSIVVDTPWSPVTVWMMKP